MMAQSNRRKGSSVLASQPVETAISTQYEVVQPSARATVSEQASAIRVLNLTEIHFPKRQPRRSVDQKKLDQLIDSVRQYGVLEPLIVRPLISGGYELVAGERRLRAAKVVGLLQIPVTVHDLTDRQAWEIALLENLQRDDLNAIDETEGILDLLCQSLEAQRDQVVTLLNLAASYEKKGRTDLPDNVTRQLATVDAVFNTIGRLNRESFRTNRLPLLNLPTDVLEFLRRGELEYTKARVISKVSDVAIRHQLMELTVESGLSLSALKTKIASMSIMGDKPQKDMRAEFRQLLQPRSAAWLDVKKQAKLEKIMMELKQLLGA
jgi:ParB family transcriptional regulator, chromosome partitioning protein